MFDLQVQLIIYKNLLTHGHSTNNIIELSIRIFKDIVLERFKVFNAAALVDFVFKVLEEYHKRCLIKFASYRVTKPQLHYKFFLDKAKELEVTCINKTMYTVSSTTETHLTYNVLLINEYECCPTGIGGKFCKHICAVHSNGFLVENTPILTTKNRIELGNLAVGNLFDPTFMEPMEDNAETERSIKH